MQPMTKKAVLVLLMSLFVAALGSAALAGGNKSSATVSSTPDPQAGDRLAAKAMTDDELAQVTAGAVPQPPPTLIVRGILKHLINVAGHTKVLTKPFTTKIGAGNSVRVKTLILKNFFKPKSKL